MATFKNRLAEIMAERDMTQSELSRLTGIRVSSISDYLRGIYEAKQDKVFQIAEALRVNPAWLMGLDVSREWPSQENDDENYYHDPEAAALADMIKDNPRYRVLFEASRNLSADDVDFVIDMINKLAKTDEDFIE